MSGFGPAKWFPQIAFVLRAKSSKIEFQTARPRGYFTHGRGVGLACQSDPGSEGYSVCSERAVALAGDEKIGGVRAQACLGEGRLMR